jgi:hypothetical protein
VSARPPVRGTAAALTAGSMISAALFVGGLVSAAARLPEFATLLANLGVVTLLATPALGLITTFVELRRLQPRSAWLAVVVLLVLGVATTVALVSR